jgi:FtsP/CotA-like multicopper oxidase with cupredoxin domain
LKDDFVTMPPGKTLQFQFKSGSAGTFYYWGQTVDSVYIARNGIDSQLSGAFIVDSPNAELVGDRVFVIGEWLGPVPPAGVARKVSVVVNGRSWPYTERLTIPFGLPAEWRVINASFGPHPMHLHGTFYTVESRWYGDARRSLRSA